MTKDLCDVLAVIYIGTNRASDAMGVPADVQCDPLLKNVQCFSAVYCRFMQPVQ